MLAVMVNGGPAFDDARNVTRNRELETDLCIVGAGAAGITLARELANKSFRICLLESGAAQFEDQTQQLNAGANIGLPYFPLITTRLRYFGGTTNHWAGESRPLDPLDFESREWIPDSGWPIARTDLQGYYEKAQKICKLGPFDYRPARWAGKGESRLAFRDPRVITTIFQRNPPVRFGTAYSADLRAAANTKVFYNANVVDIEEDETGKSIRRLGVACLSGNRFWIRAHSFVLALGAIETSRLLLLSSLGKRRGYGKGRNLVGRYFAEHPHTELGILKPPSPAVGTRLIEQTKAQVEGVGIVRGLTFGEDVLRRERLPNFQIFFKAIESPGTTSLRELIASVRRGELPDDLGDHLGNLMENFDELSWQAANHHPAEAKRKVDLLRVSATFEPVPDRDSRVTLIKRKDALGQHRVALDWRVDPAQKPGPRRIANIMAAAFAGAGLGRMRVTLDSDDTRWQTLPEGSWHQLGGTRMHTDAKLGVVDPDCRVHGLSNLYIASGSVFPTVGYANPTLTIVALAVRLADHLAARLS